MEVNNKQVSGATPFTFRVEKSETYEMYARNTELTATVNGFIFCVHKNLHPLCHVYHEAITPSDLK